jgi:phosphoribosyl-ATP pyrophosphohydrolase/phosphoribosyl-AMP cyclohydrolase
MGMQFNDQGLIPAIVQHAGSGEVLMFAWMNEESLQKTRDSGQAWFWSRSRQELWHKGATSGDFLDVTEIRYDCDVDVLLVKVQPHGATCHTGALTCFHRVLTPEDKLGELVIE